MKTVLSKRLARVADFIPQGTRLLDVGSDHAYLPIALVENQNISFAIAGEVVKGPYQSAVDNVLESGLSGQITVRLASGLAAFDAIDKIETISICGMGGRLISDILGQDVSKLSLVKRLVLQPNNRENELRLWLQENQFNIIDEDILEENDKIYEILVVEHGKMALSDDELLFGPFLSQYKSDIFLKKWQNELNKLSYALAQIPENHMTERQILEDKCKKIKEKINAS